MSVEAVGYTKDNNLYVVSIMRFLFKHLCSICSFHTAMSFILNVIFPCQDVLHIHLPISIFVPKCPCPGLNINRFCLPLHT